MRRRPLTLALAGLSLALPAAASAREPVVVLSHYDDLPGLELAVERADFPQTTVHFGDYLGSLRPTPNPNVPKKPPRAVPQGRNAPMLQYLPTEFWEKRRLDDDERARLGSAPADPLDGAIPAPRRLMRLSSTARVAWGRELGQRFRDRLRHKNGSPPAPWQFDEIVSEVARPGGRPQREFIRGILTGLTFGRPALGDGPHRGIVWAAHNALRLAERPARGELALFWKAVDRSAFAFAGEEYPEFRGSASRAAEAQAAGQRALRAGGGARRSLSAKYVVGLTPGQRLRPGLGGNVDHRSRAWVDAWRRGYVRRRAADGVAGFAVYAFRFENSPQAVMDDTVRAVALGARLVARRP